MEKLARFQQIRKDLFWEICDLEQDKIIVWWGYDDYHWWNNVARTDQFQVRGKYRLDPFSNKVTILSSSEVSDLEIDKLRQELIAQEKEEA